MAQEALEHGYLEAESWQAEQAAMEHKITALRHTITTLDQQARVMAEKARPHEARRRQLLGMLQRITSESWAAGLS